MQTFNVMSLMQILTSGFKMASGWQHLTTSWNLSLNMLEEKEKRLEFLKYTEIDRQHGNQKLSNFL